jgi:hypothetical protein
MRSFSFILVGSSVFIPPAYIYEHRQCPWDRLDVLARETAKSARRDRDALFPRSEGANQAHALEAILCLLDRSGWFNYYVSCPPQRYTSIHYGCAPGQGRETVAKLGMKYGTAAQAANLPRHVAQINLLRLIKLTASTCKRPAKSSMHSNRRERPSSPLT